MKKSIKNLLAAWLLALPLCTFGLPTVASVSGKLLKVEDAGYPLLILTVKVGKEEKIFTLNQATLNNINQGTLEGWIGESVLIDFNAVPVKNVRDVRFNNRSLVDMEGFAEGPQMQKMTGKLSASMDTNGDLPGYFDITTAKGQKTSFSFFVTEDLEKNSGKTVTVFYENAVDNEVIKIRKIPSTGGNNTVAYKRISHYSLINDNLAGWSEHLITSADDPLFQTLNAQFSMGDTPIDFKQYFAVLVAGDLTNKMTTIEIESFLSTYDGIHLTYRVVTGPALDYTQLPQTLLLVERKHLKKLNAKKTFVKQ